MRSRLPVLPFLALFLACAPAQVGQAQSNQAAPSLEIVRLINQTRTSGTRCAGGGGQRLTTLRPNAKLSQAAQGHASNMNRYSFVSHQFAGLGPRERVPQTGYQFLRMSEIIFLGRGGANRALRWWLNSKVHCRAITNPHYTEIGAANVGSAWVVVMALPR